MTDDLEGLRIVGRELGRGVRPVGFDTLLATSVRRRRRRRRTGAVAAAAVAATAAVTAYLGMPRADRSHAAPQLPPDDAQALEVVSHGMPPIPPVRTAGGAGHREPAPAAL